ncbi:MAG: SsrA-binding protein SmpB [Parcubacteria group bacterium]|nr:SsrA-binding protein SmpB [Parcubacteria group bacterium]
MALIQNKKAYFNYDIEEKLEAGIELHGFEVKALKGGRGSLDGSYVIVRGNEAYIVNMHIPPYQPGNTPAGYDPYRARKVILHKDEIARLTGIEKEKGLTAVPVSVYNKSGKIKIDIGIGRGKKKYDKRAAIKKRDTEREIGRRLKG